MIAPEGFRQSALKIIDQQSQSQLKAFSKRRQQLKSGLLNKIVDGTPFGRNYVSKEALKGIRKKTAGKLPAPEKALEVAVNAAAGKLSACLEKEALEISKLVTGSISKNLVHIFKNSERARRGDASDPQGAWNDSDSLVVLGAGTMGSGVASVALQKGVAVRLRDISVESLKKGLAYIGKQSHHFFDAKQLMQLMKVATEHVDYLMLETPQICLVSEMGDTDELTRQEQEDAGFKCELAGEKGGDPNPLTNQLSFRLQATNGRKEKTMFNYHGWTSWAHSTLVAFADLLDLNAYYYHSEDEEFTTVREWDDDADCEENVTFMLFTARGPSDHEDD